MSSPRQRLHHVYRLSSPSDLLKIRGAYKVFLSLLKYFEDKEELTSTEVLVLNWIKDNILDLYYPLPVKELK